jgi:hypothetical protein
MRGCAGARVRYNNGLERQKRPEAVAHPRKAQTRSTHQRYFNSPRPTT